MKWIRSVENNVIAGVCGGLSEMFSIDVTLVRFIFVMLCITPFPIITAYLVAWLIVPKKGVVDANNHNPRRPASNTKRGKEFLTESR
jgi:phage shock protein PspC (stress-responsive transcriptional regulator)